MEIMVVETRDFREINEFKFFLLQNKYWNLHISFWEAAVHEDDIDEELRDSKNYIIFKAILKGKMIGWIRAYQRKESCVIDQLLVHPKFRRVGAGERLVATVEETFAACLRFETCITHVNGTGFCFFHKMGYRVCRMERFGDTISVYLEKNKWFLSKVVL